MEKLTGYPSIDKPWLKYYSDLAKHSDLPQSTICEYLWDNNKGHLENIALNYFDKKITYKELFENIDRTASAFATLGVQYGDIVTICSVTTPEIIYAIYGLNKIGAVCNIIEPRTNNERILQRIIDTNSKYIIVLDELFIKIANLLKDISYKYVIIIPLFNSMVFHTKILYSLFNRNKKKIQYSKYVIKWNDFFAIKRNELSMVSYKKDIPAAIIYTGGTTGISKGTVLSNDSMNAVSHQYKCGFDYSYGEIFLNTMPPFIAYGLVCGLHMPLSLGLTVAIIPVFSPQKFDKYIIKFKPQYFLGTPSHFETLLSSNKLKNYDLSFIKFAGMGGDHLNIELEKKINSFLYEHHSSSLAVKGYGMTEMSAAACACRSNCNELGSVGIPLVNTIISVFESGTEKELPYNTKGEICISGPGMMLGYYKNREETANIIYTHKDGKKWIHTQDIGYINEDGMVFIVDRIKRMMVVEGHNVWPSVIEQTISMHPDVAECVVIGIDDLFIKNSKIPVAFIVTGDYIQKEIREVEREIIALCNEKLPERDMAKKYIFIEQIPLTSVGKVNYLALEKIAEKSQNIYD